MSAIFGGSKSKSQSKSMQTSQSVSQNQNASWNDAYPDIKQTFAPVTQSGVGANDFLSALLGLSGNPAADDAFDRYKSSNGFNFIMDSGRRAIEGSAVGRGLLQSGGTAKALQTFGQNTASQFYKDYLDRLLGMTNQGIAAGGLMAGAGQKSFGQGSSNSSSFGTSESTSTSKTKPGLGGFIGTLLSAGAGG